MKLLLNNVDCILVDGINPDLAATILNHVRKKIQFNKIALISFRPSKILNPNIEFYQIEKLTYIQYATFILKKLHQYVNANFCMTVHTDGYPYNINKWSEDFLKYDYIGAPWFDGNDFNDARVGNSGFCIRSKKLLQRLAKDDIIHLKENDDILICSKYKNLLTNEGFTFADINTAAKFSWSGDIPEIPVAHRNRKRDVFGGHYPALERFLL